MDGNKLPELLGRPAVNLTVCQMSCFEHLLDDTHIIKFEYDGDLEAFDAFNING